MLCPPFQFDWRRVKFFLVIVLVLPSFPLLAQEITPQTCSSSLNDAQNQLFRGDFEQAMALLQPCIDANAYENDTDRVRAFELLANVFIAINDEPQARSAIAQLLDTDPDYEPDPDQSRSDYILLINEMKALHPPATPTIASIEAEDFSVTLTWVHADTSVASYVVSRGTSRDTLVTLATVEAPTGTYVDTAVEYNTRYFYTLEARKANAVASNQSGIASVLTPVAPDIAGVNQPERRGVSRWVFIGGGVVAGGLAAVLLSGGGDTDPPPDGTGLGELTGPPPVP